MTRTEDELNDLGRAIAPRLHATHFYSLGQSDALQWIDCKTQDSPEGVFVLVMYEGRPTEARRYPGCYQKQSGAMLCEYHRIKFWMPLPPPPKAEGNKRKLTIGIGRKTYSTKTETITAFVSIVARHLPGINAA